MVFLANVMVVESRPVVMLTFLEMPQSATFTFRLCGDEAGRCFGGMAGPQPFVCREWCESGLLSPGTGGAFPSLSSSSHVCPCMAGVSKPGAALGKSIQSLGYRPTCLRVLAPIPISVVVRMLNASAEGAPPGIGATSRSVWGCLPKVSFIVREPAPAPRIAGSSDGGLGTSPPSLL